MKLRRPTQILGLLLLTLMVSAWGGCTWFTKADGTKTTPLEQAKIVQKAASDSWMQVQETFAKARVRGEQAEKAAKPLGPDAITEDQWKRFAAVGVKVVFSGRELAQITRAIETGTSKDTTSLQAKTDQLFALFETTASLADAFGLKLPITLPKKAVTASTSALPFALAVLPLGAALVPRRRGGGNAARPTISGGAGIDPEMVLQIAAGMTAASGPLVAEWVTNNPGDESKAKAAAMLLASLLAGAAKVLPGIMEGARDPASINLEMLWAELPEETLERIRRENA